MLRKSTVWLLDEPTAHLDGDAEAQIVLLLRQLAVGRTIIVATHSDAMRQAADVVVRLPAPVRVVA
jgi:ATP-binding cassette subfamily C protein CydD